MIEVRMTEQMSREDFVEDIQQFGPEVVVALEAALEEKDIGVVADVIVQIDDYDGVRVFVIDA